MSKLILLLLLGIVLINITVECRHTNNAKEHVKHSSSKLNRVDIDAVKDGKDITKSRRSKREDDLDYESNEHAYDDDPPSDYYNNEESEIQNATANLPVNATSPPTTTTTQTTTTLQPSPSPTTTAASTTVSLTLKNETLDLGALPNLNESVNAEPSNSIVKSSRKLEDSQLPGLPDPTNDDSSEEDPSSSENGMIKADGVSTAADDGDKDLSLSPARNEVTTPETQQGSASYAVVIGIIVVIALVGVAGFFYARNKKGNSNQEEPKSRKISNPGTEMRTISITQNPVQEENPLLVDRSNNGQPMKTF